MQTTLLALLLAASASAYTSPRTPIVSGNWKMNPGSVEDAKALAGSLETAEDREVVVFPPALYLPAVADTAAPAVHIGAQDACPLAEAGAFTGAVSFPMLASLPRVSYILAGHSERRTIFGDDDAYIHDMVRKTLDGGFSSMLCIGETKAEYDAGLCNDICAVQLAKALEGVTAEEMSRVVIAYEPVWAIGTGLTCPAGVAQTVHAAIRGRLAETYGKDVAEDVRILYGGSVNPAVIDGIMAKPDIDGVLVGGASLSAGDFAKITHFHKGWWRTKGFLKKVLPFL